MPMLSRRHFMAAACREIIPPSGQDLLNVTLRLVEADTTSVLSFAPAARIAAVMLFPQAMTAAERRVDARHDREADRPRARARRQLLFAVPAARAAGSVARRTRASTEIQRRRSAGTIRSCGSGTRCGRNTSREARYAPRLTHSSACSACCSPDHPPRPDRQAWRYRRDCRTRPRRSCAGCGA